MKTSTFSKPMQLSRFNSTHPNLDTDALIKHLSPHRMEYITNLIEPVVAAEAYGVRVLTCFPN